MARGVPGFVRIGAALAGCALVAACMPESGPTETASPSAPVSPTSPTPSATLIETEIERQQRLDFEAAEQAYRSAAAEQDRLARLGVARTTSELKRTATGNYLKFALEGLKDLEDAGWRSLNNGKIVGVSRGGWKERSLRLVACEDGSSIRLVDKSGKDVTPKVARTFIQDLTVTRYADGWKVSDARSERVNSFDGAPCAA